MGNPRDKISLELMESGALSGKKLLVRIIDSNKIDIILGQVMLTLSRRVRKKGLL